MAKLILIRHGESTANAKNEYTGWNDVDLTPKGEQQARDAAKIISNIPISEIHTSVLKRAIKTAYIIADYNDLNSLPITKTWRLNERHYGALRGKNKDATRIEYGKEQVQLWRRSFYSRPPLLDRRDELVGPYRNLDPEIMPKSESLYDSYLRIMPYFQDVIAPKLKDGKNQLVVAHGSTIRALMKYIEQISDEGIDGIEVENGDPVIYEFDNELDIISSK
ncbi:2,3-bisphosphoglycerate-dependent phosphoglycerate mutase [Lactobacillus terrae]|uniref:2,3-bisphosphoglycerate-dependent phosphoglycerate mutase n=1 Tax=Lactobacillus terrae TaxID=2269374 RepID=UPI000C1B6721|nr:2,3-diphosphoglycerate-dependent phosphoglycerate mutase [Lactobacillus terrae]